ncbi:Cu-Zn family superoxide dismutase [Acidovorax sp. 107]|uniref:superoxide dismutase family protein n=1 Tax=Acidovorax sp. 107 TaxID=2135638 RepID=UPI000D3828CE|nr:superoxide dismutase family protein [Acidovorax sp. 107]PUA96926.1 Cu-Zn family superoxide dismutase [Acidovorax sp. 107]
MKIRFAFALSSLAAVALVGCASHLSGNRAMAKLEPTRGNTANGTVTFVQTDEGVQVSGEIRGLKPGAEHGFHVHEKGDCSSGDGMSTGGHFNPTAKPHGAHSAAEHHTGDLPSLKADKYGVAAFSFVSKSISVGGPTTDIVGKGLIVHRDPDDYQTQPTGNAGPRLACAVIASK